MKKLLFIALLFPLCFTACKKDPCDGITCSNGGTCSNGDCNCTNTYYEGPACQTKRIAKYTGTYTVADACLVPGSSISVTEVSFSKVRIHNLFETGVYFDADFVNTGNGFLTIPAQIRPTFDGNYLINGTTAYNAGTLTLNYRLQYIDDANSANDFDINCTAVCSK